MNIKPYNHQSSPQKKKGKLNKKVCINYVNIENCYFGLKFCWSLGIYLFTIADKIRRILRNLIRTVTPNFFGMKSK